MRKVNMPLIVGALIIILLMAVIVFPEVFTSKSPYNMQHMIFSHEGGELEVDIAPFPPSSQFILGSDDMGRDIYSFIIYGTGLTILLGVLTALARFLIAVPFALSAGFGNKMAKTTIRQFNILFSAIPALLISVIILKLDFLAGLEKSTSILAFVLVLSVVGWPKLGSLLMERVDAINNQPFIRSEVAVGKSRFRIAVENVFPHLAPEMIVLFFMEVARALSTIMQLGIFSVFVGFLKIIMDTEGGITFYNVSFEPEWAGMLSTSKNLLSTAPWAVIFPAVAFFISVLGFNLFGEGLRNLLQSDDSLFVPKIRKILSFDIRYMWSSAGRKGRIAAIIIPLIIIVSITAVVIGGIPKPMDIEISDLLENESVVIGTDEAALVSDMIAKRMGELGLAPIGSDEFKHLYEIPAVSLIESQELSIINYREYVPGTDYAILSLPEGNLSGKVTDLTREDLFSLKDFRQYEEGFVLIDKAYYNDAAVEHFIQRIEDESSVDGVLLVARAGEILGDKYAGRSSKIARVVVSRDLAEDIKESGDTGISIKLKSIPLDNVGINIVGMLEGMDELLNEEVILIGFPYNYTDKGEMETVGFGIRLMEEICSSDVNRRSVVFAFFDATDSERLNGLNAFSNDYPYSPSKTKLFINLLDMDYSRFDSLIYSAKQAPFTRQYAWSMGRQLEQNMEKAGIGINEAESVFFGDQYYFTGSSSYNTLFMNNGIATIIIASDEEGSQKTLGDLGRILVDTINDNNY